jgi:hypothetical protein
MSENMSDLPEEVQEFVKKARYNRDIGKIVWSDTNVEAAVMTRKGGARSVVRLDGYDVREDTLVWWFERGEWIPDGLFHANGKPSDCSIMNLRREKVEVEVEPVLEGEQLRLEVIRKFYFDEITRRLRYKLGVLKDEHSSYQGGRKGMVVYAGGINRREVDMIWLLVAGKFVEGKRELPGEGLIEEYLERMVYDEE